MTLVEIDHSRAAVPVVTLHDPGRYNALSGGLITDLMGAINALAADRAVRVMILRGAGKGFCAGADLTGGAIQELAPGADGRGRVGTLFTFQEHLSDLVLAISECPKPVVAAVHGAAIGGGLSLALACDIRLCSDDATFGARYIRMGLSSCEMGTSYLLPRAIGLARAAELMLTGRDFGAAEAERIGLVHRVTTEAELLGAAVATADVIAENSEYGVWMTKVGLAAAVDAPSLRHAIALENRTQVIGALTGNMVEAARAFAERRPPTWRPF